MSAMTVHRPLERVNTLVRVAPEGTPGTRLKAYIEAHWGRKRGGMEQLAVAAGLRGRQTLYEWFAGSEPSLPSLEQVAAVLKVRRVDLVAAYDGVTAPETEKEPPPTWATAMEERLTEALLTNRTVFVETMATHFARLGVERALAEQPQDEHSHGTQEPTPGQAGQR